MVTTASIARVAALIGDPTRASMLQALMEGRALTAAELAGVARVAPPNGQRAPRPAHHSRARHGRAAGPAPLPPARDAAGGAYALILSQNQVDSSAHRSRSAPLE